MNFKDKMTQALINRGIFDDEAAEVVRLAMDHESLADMKQRWMEDTGNYPKMMVSIVWISVQAIALDYIDNNCPKAWFRQSVAA